METIQFLPNSIVGKMTMRKTGEEVEVIAFEQKMDGARSDDDWVTYIDKDGEHIREHLNLQLDFKAPADDALQQIMGFAAAQMPSERNRRVYETAKEIFLNLDGYEITDAVETAKELVDAVGIETE